MAIYYVDFTTGDDADTGLSEALAWKTINKVNTSSFSAGDSILFKRGETWREQLTIPSAGGAGNPITIGAYGIGADPLILGSTAVATWTTTVVAPITGDLITESFNAAGYDTAGWAESVGAGSVCDEDSTAIADSAGGATQILKIQNVSPNWTSGTRLTLAADNPISYSQLYLYIAVDGMTNSTVAQIAQARDSTSKNSWTLSLSKTAGGVLQFFASYYTSGGETVTASLAIATGQWYKHEFFYDTTNSLWEWRINGNSIGSGALASVKSAGLKILTLGSYSSFSKANTIYYDAVKVSSTGYPTAGNTETTWKATYAGGDPVAIWAVDSAGLPHWGVKRSNDASCVGLYDWFYNAGDTTLHINSGGTTSGFDPDTLWDSVEAATRSAGIFAQSKANLTIQDIEVRHSVDNGIYLYRLCHNAIIQRCTPDYNFVHGVAGITGGGTEAPNDVQVTNCVAAYNGLTGISLSDYGRRWTVSHNTVHHNGADYTQSFPAGIKLYGPNGSGGHIIEYNDVYLNGNALYTGGAAGAIWIDRLDDPASPAHIPAIIRYNKTYNNLMNGIFHEKVSRSEVYYNLIYGNINGVSTDTAGYRLDAFLAHSASANHVYNNLIYGNYIGMKIQSDESAAGQIIDNLFKNNICVGNTLRQLAATAGGNNEGTFGSGNVYDYNCFGAEAANFIEWGVGVLKSTYATWLATAGADAAWSHNVNADPLMTDPGAGDFTLQITSPCIDAGVDVGLTTDYIGTSIPQGAAPDIGAYEYQPSGGLLLKLSIADKRPNWFSSRKRNWFLY